MHVQAPNVGQGSGCLAKLIFFPGLHLSNFSIMITAFSPQDSLSNLPHTHSGENELLNEAMPVQQEETSIVDSSRYQLLLIWRKRVQEATNLIWLSSGSLYNWSYFGVDARQLSREWYAYTLKWVLSQLKHNADKRVQKCFQKYVKRFQKVNSLLERARQAEFELSIAKCQHLLDETSLINSPWTQEFAKLTSSVEGNVTSVLFYILRQRPDLLVGTFAQPAILTSRQA